MRPPRDIPPAAEWLPSPKWIRAYAGGRKMVDSRRAMLLRQDGRPAFYYFPETDVAMDCLTADSEENGTLRYRHQKKGAECAWQLMAGGKHPPELNGHLTFDWSAMDAWFEEDEEVFVHARDPRVRVDTLHSSRHVRVVVLGETVAETHHPVLLFETGLPVRYYIPKLDVNMALLEPSPHATRCPYKGEAGYYSVCVDGRRAENIAWYYRYPTDEVHDIATLLAFYGEHVDAIYVDGEPIQQEEA